MARRQYRLIYRFKSLCSKVRNPLHVAPPIILNRSLSRLKEDLKEKGKTSHLIFGRISRMIP